MTRRLPSLLSALLLSGCTATISQDTFFPRMNQSTTQTLVAPAGTAMTDELIDLPGLGQVRVVRLDNPASDAAVIYSGGNGNFVNEQTGRAAALAKATGADVILYDYPGRGGTTVPPTIDAALETGPALLSALRTKGWIGAGPLYAYGLSFGGSQATAMARNGGFDGLILEGTVADVLAAGRGFVPWYAKPFVNLKLDENLLRFDTQAYALAAKAPILLISGRLDTVVRPKLMRTYADRLKAGGADVTLVSVPDAHGLGLRQPEALAAIKSFVRQSMPVAARLGFIDTDDAVSVPALANADWLSVADGVFRHLLTSRRIAGGAAIVCLAQRGPSGTHLRLPRDFVGRLTTEHSDVRQLSQCAWNGTRWVDRDRQRGAIVLRIDEVRCSSPSSCIAQAGYEEANLSAATNEYTLERRKGAWVVTGERPISIS